MESLKITLRSSLGRTLGVICMAIALAFFSLPLRAEAALPAGNAIKDGEALLRYALPIANEDIRKVQEEVETIAYSLRGLRWSSAQKNVSNAIRTYSLYNKRILEAVPAARQAAAQPLIDDLNTALFSLKEAVGEENGDTTFERRATVLSLIGQIEALMVEEFPFEVPAEYRELPYLTGRATVEMSTNQGDLTIVVDGFSAPITAGNFVDLVDRGFYDGLPITRAEEFYVVQFGDPAGPETGFVDPDKGNLRTIPFEVLVQGDEEPIYEFTLDSLGIYPIEPVLPFSAYGTVGMAYPSGEPNGGSSQVFFFLYEPELTPAGSNLLDGRYAAFGYVTEGAETLERLRVGDVIQSATVVSGLDKLVQPS
ncbi:MAG: peptidylprolyl isomerase [Prochlorothrix sp.]